MPRNRSLPPPHLERRRSAWYWHRRWPRAITAEGGCNPSRNFALCLSLRTEVLRDAKILGRRLTALADTVFAVHAETTMAIAPHTHARLLEDLARFEIDAFERARALAGPRSTRHRNQCDCPFLCNAVLIAIGTQSG